MAMVKSAAQTLKREVCLRGVGLHSGREANLRLSPALAATGIIFVRTDLPGCPALSATDVDPQAPPFRMTLKKGAAEIQTVEHLLASLSGLRITDCKIELDGLEVPGLDGSALPFVTALREAGTASLGASAPALTVDEPLAIEDSGASISVQPYPDALKISYTLHYPGHPLAQGFFTCEITEEVFIKELAPARTFAIKKDAEAMRAAGLGRGANLQNTVVIDGTQVLETTLRFKDEPVRHKVLDLIGDLYTLGCPLHGHVIAKCSGHRHNRLLAGKLRTLVEACC